MSGADPGLARLFAAAWDAFLGGLGIDPGDLEKLIADTGLAVWRPATEDEIAEYAGWELEPGDQLLCLTDEGRAIVREGRNEPAK